MRDRSAVGVLTIFSDSLGHPYVDRMMFLALAGLPMARSAPLDVRGGKAKMAEARRSTPALLHLNWTQPAFRSERLRTVIRSTCR